MTTIAPSALILSGYGLNCEEETKLAFETAGGRADIVHINDIITQPKLINDYQIVSLPGGFSYGDHTGSGHAFAQKIKNHLFDIFSQLKEQDKLVIGICNGCQILVKLGLLFQNQEKADLFPNTHGQYECRWIHLTIPETNSIWFKDIKQLYIPVAHKEGCFYFDDETLEKCQSNQMIAAQYADHKGDLAAQSFPTNPNGSMNDTAALTNETGRILAMMPHPERALFFHQREDWPLQKEKYKRQNKACPEYGDGYQIFKNAIEYFH